MSKEPAFWDASALVRLCVNESNSRRAQLQLRESLPVVWWASSTEVHSAVARLHRQGKLRDVEKKSALARLDVLSRAWREILPTDSLRDTTKGRKGEACWESAEHRPDKRLLSPPLKREALRRPQIFPELLKSTAQT